MASFIAETSNYLFVGIMFLYVISNFGVFFFDNPETHKHFYFGQILMGIMFHAVGYVTLFVRSGDARYFFFFALQELMILAIAMIYHTLYPSLSRQLLNNMIMLLYVGFVILGRLSLEDSLKQFIYTIIILVFSMIIPYAYKTVKVWSKMGYVYCGIGIVLLVIVWLTGAVTNGSKLAIRIFDMTFQPSEFVKLSLVFFIASILCNKKDKYRYVIAGLFSAAHIIILVLSKDLGSAAIYAVTFICMMYLANNNELTLLGGGLLGGAGFFAAYNMFSHVRVRVKTWLMPWDDMQASGYQLTQALFAIGTGGWFGMGLLRGTPSSIPYVNEDFIFSAISEEMGVVFGICLILLYLVTVLQIFRMSMQVRSKFHKMVLCGFGTMFAFQVFLTIGGGTRLIPLTGVTLPLISMGGSSLASTILMITIIQSIYVLEFGYMNNESEAEIIEELDAPDTDYDDYEEDEDNDEYEDDYIDDYVDITVPSTEDIYITREVVVKKGEDY